MPVIAHTAVVVPDDDPTGTQPVADLPVLLNRTASRIADTIVNRELRRPYRATTAERADTLGSGAKVLWLNAAQRRAIEFAAALQLDGFEPSTDRPEESGARA